MTDGNQYYLDKREADQEEYDFRDEYDEIAADNVRLEARVEELEAKALANRVAVMRLEAKLAKAREEGFWAGRSCGGSKKEIDAALAELKGQDDECTKQNL